MILHVIPESLLRTIVAYAVVLGILVFVHELGHYAAARWRGVYVEVFSIGFGKPLASWTDRLGTQWKLCLLPIGGYVKMHGQERPEDVSAEVRAGWRPGQTFHEKSVLSRAIIVAAGPIANFLLAVVLFAGLFATAGQPTALAVVGTVMADSAAARAGLQSGDRILAIDGTPLDSFAALQRIVVAHPGQSVTLRLERDKTARDQAVLLGSHAVDGHAVGLLGITGGAVAYHRLAPLAAIGAGVTQTGDLIGRTLQGVWQIITGQRGTEDLGGPLRIAQLSGEVAQLGLLSIISFIAVLSVNLGLINLFPIPILDGGHLLFYAAEALRGRPMSTRAQDVGFRAGLALIVALFVFATWNDLARFGLFHWVASRIG
jgi:regulator of sigma E protease